MLSCTVKLRDRCLLMAAYSAGFRVDELIHVKFSDIGVERMMIRVEQGKGKKDRYTILSQRLLCELKKYKQTYQPVSWVFFGKSRNEPLHISAAQKIYNRAKHKSGIEKGKGIHTRYYAELDDDIFGGSFVHLGNSLMTRLSREKEFRLYCLCRSLQHAGRRLPARSLARLHSALAYGIRGGRPRFRNAEVRGYSWFRSSSFFDVSGSIICDKCERSFPVEDARYECCQGCGHHGDLPAPVPYPELFTPHLRPLA